MSRFALKNYRSNSVGNRKEPSCTKKGSRSPQRPLKQVNDCCNHCDRPKHSSDCTKKFRKRRKELANFFYFFTRKTHKNLLLPMNLSRFFLAFFEKHRTQKKARPRSAEGKACFFQGLC